MNQSALDGFGEAIFGKVPLCPTTPRRISRRDRACAPMTAPLAGARLDKLGEDPGEMALVGKAARLSDLGQRQRRVDEQLLCLLDPLLHQPAVRRLACRLSEGAGKMARRELAGARQFHQRYRLVEARDKYLFCTPQLPRRQSATRRGRWQRHRIVCLAEVG